MKISIVSYVNRRRFRSAVAVATVAVGSVAAGVTSHAQTVYTYYTGNSNAYLNASHWLVGGASSTTVSAVFPGVTANGSATANGTITDIADFGTLYVSTAGVLTSQIGINFNTSTNNGKTTNTAAAGSLTVGAFDFTSALAGPLSVGNSSTTAAGTGTLTLTGQTLNGIANTIVSNESTSVASLVPSVAPASGSQPAMSVGLNNTTTNVIQTTNTGGIVISANIINGTGTNASNNVTINSSGTGAVTFSGANTYAGTTTVTAGTLLVNGTNSGTGAVAVNGGTLGGGGTIAGNTTVAAGASLAPGATGGTSAAKLTLGTATTGTTAINGTYRVDLGGTTAGTTYDQVSVLGALTLNTTSSSLVINSVTTTLTVGEKFYIALNDGVDPVVGTFSQGTTVTDGSGDTYTISYTDNGDGGTVGNDVSLTVATLAAVPEPATVLGGALLMGTVGWGQRRRVRGLAGWMRACKAA